MLYKKYLTHTLFMKEYLFHLDFVAKISLSELKSECDGQTGIFEGNTFGCRRSMFL